VGGLGRLPIVRRSEQFLLIIRVWETLEYLLGERIPRSGRVEDTVGFVGGYRHHFLYLVVQGLLIVEGDGAKVFNELVLGVLVGYLALNFWGRRGGYTSAELAEQEAATL
jgi:hypothetical protein